MPKAANPELKAPATAFQQMYTVWGRGEMAQKEPLELGIELVKIVGALVVFIVSLRQYSKAQRWKRREFIAAQIKEFEADPRNRVVMIFLDWSDRKIAFPTDDGEATVKILVTDVLLCGSLLPHGRANGFNPDEVIIRDSIDRFLESLVRFENFVEAKLIDVEELRPYLQYWIRLITGDMPDRHPAEVFQLLLNYIDQYGFDGVSRLIAHFGYSPKPDPVAVEKAIVLTVAVRAKYEWNSIQDASAPSGQTPGAQP